MKPGDVIDEHVIESALGKGAYGQVYKVRHQASNDLMALKIARATGNPTDLERFNAENAMMHRLSPHDNILSPISLVIQHSPDLSYYTMELADHALEHHLHLNQLTTPDLIGLFKDICNGLGHAHQTNIAHRDLHWGNILLRAADTVWVVKLTDFGKAKDTTAVPLTTSEPCWGWFVTPPEIDFRLWGDTPSLRNLVTGDMYALGILLYFLFGGIHYVKVVGLKYEITSFLQSKKDVASMSEKERRDAYQEWLKSVRVDNHSLSVQLIDAEDTRKVNELLSRLTNIDHAQRFESVAALQRRLVELYP